MSTIDKVREEFGALAAFVAANPKKYSIALFVIGLAAGAFFF